MTPTKSVRYVCPRNGLNAYCEVCGTQRTHRCEVLAPEGRPPDCPTHRIPMVTA